jgi:hypothetical protein
VEHQATAEAVKGRVAQTEVGGSILHEELVAKDVVEGAVVRTVEAALAEAPAAEVCSRHEALEVMATEKGVAEH